MRTEGAQAGGDLRAAEFAVRVESDFLQPRLGTTRCPAAAAIRLFMSRWACFWWPRPWQRCSRQRLRAAGSDPMRALRQNANTFKLSVVQQHADESRIVVEGRHRE